ncbi:hypothetical protein Acr_00g0054650 [Actinidia rufa]|uniref:Uncharacterized protein n=1 Tax=Actinidia rufa TaxID=165716 RepID=A0A7J0DNP1_9ERIC|nr:hypothetical protein Acr_00g0054650 [Actinidia rufa]
MATFEMFGNEKRRWWRGSGEEEIGDPCKDGGGDKAVGRWVCEDGYGGKDCRRCVYGYLGRMHRLDGVIGIGKFEENSCRVISEGLQTIFVFFKPKMACFSDLGIGLSFVFGCILLGLVGELYYLLWWKKKFSSTSRGIEDHHHFPNYVKFVPNLFCWKKPNSTTQTQQVTDPEANGSDPDPDPELGSAKEDVVCKGYGEEGVASELMRLHNLCGPPRFLFTISEETKEDLESNDGRSRKGSRTRSLSDFFAC